MAKSVSVIVVNHNSGGLLADCIRSALPAALEVIVVDNDSSDGSTTDSRSFFTGNSRLRFIENGANLGFAAACNIGMRAALGDRLLFLNPDCRLEENTIRKLRDALDAAPNAGMAGGLLLNPDGSEQGGGRRAVPTPWRSFVRAFGLSRLASRWPKLFFDFHLHKQPLPKAPIEVEAISGACMMIKREVAEQIGEWDEGYFLHCEDLDWCMRFRRAGFRILFVPDARLEHVLGACGRSRPVFVEWHKHRGMLRFYGKFFRHQYPGALWWLVFIGVWLRFSAVAAVKFARSLRRQPSPEWELQETSR